MLALFWYSPVPYWRTSNRDGQPGFFLSGDTYDELAWDLVEQFFDGFMTTEPFKPMAWAAGLMGSSDFDPSLSRVNAYKERRFSDAWWNDQIKRFDSYFLNSPASSLYAGKSYFREQISEGDLLGYYLTIMISKYYGKHHGIPEWPGDSESTLEFFEKHTYLKWIPTDSLETMEKVMTGDLRSFW